MTKAIAEMRSNISGDPYDRNTLEASRRSRISPDAC
jgi:hypothetical protein